MIRAALLALLALPAQAQPQFIDRSAGLPGPHIYSGGWEHFVGGGVAAFDCDGDALPDLFAAGGDTPARLMRNTAAPGDALGFADISDRLPGPLTGVTGAYPLDIDGDSALDLVVLRVGANVLLRGLGGCRFAVSDWGFDGLDRWTAAFSAMWPAGATRPTLAFGNYVNRDDPDGPFGACDVNHLYRPDAYGAPIALAPGHCALSMLFSDWRRDGHIDLRVSNDRHYYVRGGAEQMWRMTDPPRLLGPADGWDRVSIWGMGIASQDLNGDGLPDVMLTSMGDQLLQFAGATRGFTDAPYALGTTAHRPHVGDDGRPSTGWHAAFGDVDNDGRTDIFIAKGNVDQMPGMAMQDPNSLLMQAADGSFAEAAEDAGIATMDRSRGAALVDFNRDGRLDLVVMNRRAGMELWENTSPPAAWLAVDISQPGPNRRAVGAWVELRRASGRVEAREVTVGGGHASGTAVPVHFGLGGANGADVRVIWPDGAATDWRRLAAGAIHAIAR
ncbi:MAG: hypothetical protein ACJAVR_001529 [Paracoccaceae bacterium]|jgi:hypothetical protein